MRNSTTKTGSVHFAEGKFMVKIVTSESAKKKLIIIGAGISGLSAGVYAQKAGYATEIYEKNAVPGGECMGWDRKGYHIDGCIHWLTGTNPNDPLNKVWRQTGALSDNVKIYQSESFVVLDTGDRTVHLYKDFEKLKSHLLEISPEDKEPLEELFAATQACFHAAIPMHAPELMGPIEMIKMMRSMGSQQKIMKSMNMSLGDYVKRFKSDAIRTALVSVLPSEQCANILPYTLATVVTGNGGRPAGGSRAMAQRMEDTFCSLGGVLHLATPVEDIVIENQCAAGVRLAGKPGAVAIVRADHILSATDIHVTLAKFLHGKYPLQEYAMRDADPLTYPAPTGIYVTLGIDMDLSNMDPDLLIQTEPFTLEGNPCSRMSLKHFCYEPSFAPEGHSVIGVFLSGKYDWWKALISDETSDADAVHIKSQTYIAEKDRLIHDIIRVLEIRFPAWKGHMIPLDVVTPLTYERYCGAYRGQWMAYGNTPQSKRLMNFGKIKGLSNFSMSGQWLLPPGGLPVAVITGKWAIQRLCKMDKLLWRW